MELEEVRKAKGPNRGFGVSIVPVPVTYAGAFKTHSKIRR